MESRHLGGVARRTGTTDILSVALGQRASRPLLRQHHLHLEEPIRLIASRRDISPRTCQRRRALHLVCRGHVPLRLRRIEHDVRKVRRAVRLHRERRDPEVVRRHLRIQPNHIALPNLPPVRRRRLRRRLVCPRLVRHARDMRVQPRIRNRNRRRLRFRDGRQIVRDDAERAALPRQYPRRCHRHRNRIVRDNAKRAILPRQRRRRCIHRKQQRQRHHSQTEIHNSQLTHYSSPVKWWGELNGGASRPRWGEPSSASRGSAGRLAPPCGSPGGFAPPGRFSLSNLTTCSNDAMAE